MLIVQISDLHVAAADAPVRRFVDTNANLARAIAYIESMRPRPDLVVATGDLTDNGLPEEERRRATCAKIGRSRRARATESGRSMPRR